MKYTQYIPPAVLQPHVRYFWTYETTGNALVKVCIRSFADRYPRLIFQDLSAYEPIRTFDGVTMPLCYLSGIDTQPTAALMNGNWSHFGVSFYPHALHTFFGISAHELTDEVPDIRLIHKTPLAAQLQAAADTRERIAVVSRYLYERLRFTRQPPSIPHVIHAGEITMNSHLHVLHEKYHMSERHFERLFKQSVGISARKYQRIQRFEQALQLLSVAQYQELTGIAYHLGYTDQSHFIKDFKSFSGVTPYNFARERNLGSESASFLYAYT